MADVHTPEQRARNMRAVRNRDTDPEIVVRKILFAGGFRFRLHVRALPGVPDIVLPKHRAVIFVNGCFWHGHDCHLFKTPKTRTEFWMGKIDGNRARDGRNTQALAEAGWRVLTVWECAVRGRLRHTPYETGDALAAWLTAGQGGTAVGELRHRQELGS
jgi:DNA mismatch endonuclease (patch repair protein)